MEYLVNQETFPGVEFKSEIKLKTLKLFIKQMYDRQIIYVAYPFMLDSVIDGLIFGLNQKRTMKAEFIFCTGNKTDISISIIKFY